MHERNPLTLLLLLLLILLLLLFSDFKVLGYLKKHSFKCLLLKVMIIKTEKQKNKIGRIYANKDQFNLYYSDQFK